MPEPLRTVRRTEVAQGMAKITVKVVDGFPTEKGSQDSYIRQLELLRMLHENPSIHACDFDPFQDLHMYHDGVAWVIVCEAIARVNT